MNMAAASNERSAQLKRAEQKCAESFANIWLPFLDVLSLQERRLGDLDVEPAATFKDLVATKPENIKGERLIFWVIILGAKIAF